jgi:hypothetical protein
LGRSKSEFKADVFALKGQKMPMLQTSLFIFLNHRLWKTFSSTPLLGITNSEVLAFLRKNQGKNNYTIPFDTVQIGQKM